MKIPFFPGKGLVPPSRFAEYYFNLGGARYSLDRFPYLRDVYNDNSREQVLVFGRQCMKSSSMCGKLLGLLSMIPHTHALHVSPTEVNRNQFAKDRLEPFMQSPKWREQFYNKQDTDNLYRKELNNDSVIHLRNAYRTAGRARGLTAGYLQFDEVQDILNDSIAVIRECQNVPDFKMTVMAGTQSSVESSINYYWELSDQKEFCLRCNGCSKWNALGERNIGKTSLICASCGRPMHVVTNPWQWIPQAPGAMISGYRFPQIAFPLQDWDALLLKLKTYSREKVYNEILALPYDGGQKPISRAELMQICCGQARFLEPHETGGWRTFAGIDWGHGMGSTTQIVVLRELQQGKCELIYAHKFDGFESDPIYQRVECLRIAQKYQCQYVCADWGDGREANKILRVELGTNRYFPVYLSGNQKEVMEWKAKDEMFVASREQSLSDLFTCMKRMDITLPEWPVIGELAEEILNVYSKYSVGRRMSVYDHHPERPDDFCHALNFAFLAFGLAMGKYRPTGYATW